MIFSEGLARERFAWNIPTKTKTDYNVALVLDWTAQVCLTVTRHSHDCFNQFMHISVNIYLSCVSMFTSLSLLSKVVFECLFVCLFTDFYQWHFMAVPVVVSHVPPITFPQFGPGVTLYAEWSVRLWNFVLWCTSKLYLWLGVSYFSVEELGGRKFVWIIKPVVYLYICLDIAWWRVHLIVLCRMLWLLFCEWTNVKTMYTYRSILPIHAVWECYKM